MIGDPTQHRAVRRVGAVALVFLVIVAIGAVAYGGYHLAMQDSQPMGLAFVGGGCVIAAVAVFLYGNLLFLYRILGYAYRAYGTLLETSELLRQQESHGRTIAENSSLSEWAKRVVYREKDYEFLRDTIQSSIVRQDWEAAEHLIRDMQQEFGYHDEAAHLREKLEQARQATTEERIAAALSRFDELCRQHKWGQAYSECERLQSLFPEDSRIVELPVEIDHRRQDVKRKLLREYDQAVRNQDIDRAHRLLFAIDQYIEPSEAEALKESARGVFRARLEQLKTQFTIAVSYKQFAAAIDGGERLIREFPNSGYAQEISKLMPVLRQRARQQRSHASTANPPAHN